MKHFFQRFECHEQSETDRIRVPTLSSHAVTGRLKLQIAIVIIATLALLATYYLLIFLGWGKVVMIVYMTALAVLLTIYVLYNRAFVFKNATPDTLTNDWTDEKKRSFLDNCQRRSVNSKWILVAMLPLIFVFMADVLYLFVWCQWLEPLLSQTHA